MPVSRNMLHFRVINAIKMTGTYAGLTVVTVLLHYKLRNSLQGHVT